MCVCVKVWGEMAKWGVCVCEGGGVGEMAKRGGCGREKGWGEMTKRGVYV